MENCNPINQAGSPSSNFRSSDINVYDGATLTNINNIVVGSSSLNDVVREIDTVIGTTANALSSNVQFNGTLASCITATGDLNDILLAVSNEICSNSTSVKDLDNRLDNLDTGEIYSVVAYSNCVGTYTTSNTLRELIDGMMAKICSNATEIDSVQGLEFDFGAGLGTTTWGTGGIKDLVYYGGDWSYTTGLTGSIVESNSGYSEYVSSGKHKKVADEVITLQASSDNYVYYNVTSEEYVVTSVSVGSPEPSASGVKLYKLTTDASNVTATQDLRNFYNIDGTRFTDDIILTRHITDGDVTGAKLEDHTTAGSLDLGLGSFSVDVKGRVSSLVNKVNISSLQDNQVLVYDQVSDTWMNEDFSSAALPTGSSGDTLRYSGSSWVVSSFVKSFSSSLSIATEGITNEALQIGTSGIIAIESPTPAAPTVSGSLGASTLAADTYYYAVSYISQDDGESMVSDETSIVIDGIGSNIADISITPVASALEYRVYKGTVSGTYTEYFTVTTSSLSYSDDGTAGTAGTPVSGSSAYALRISSTGIGYNYLERPSSPFIFYTDDTRVDQFMSLTVDGTRASDLVVFKADATATNTSDNIAGQFTATGGANNYTLRLIDGVDNTDKFLKVNDAVGNVVFADPTVMVKDETTTIGDFKSFRFIGNGVTAADGGSGEIDITITGSVTEFDNMVDVSVSSASNYDTLRYNGTNWVNDSFLQNTGSRIGIGTPTTIEAKLHISAASDKVLKIENSTGDIADIDTDGVLTYAKKIKYTYTNSGVSPLGAGKVLTSDANGNATWETLTSTGIGSLVEDTTPQLGGTLDANNFNIDMGVNTITDPKVGQWDTAYSWGDHSTAGYALVGTYNSGYVPRWNATTNTLESGSIEDDGTTVGIGIPPNSSNKLLVSTSAMNTAVGGDLTYTGGNAHAGFFAAYGSNSNINIGAWGKAYNSTTNNIGVVGTTGSDSARVYAIGFHQGVVGQSRISSGNNMGVYGEAITGSGANTGVFGLAQSTGANAFGVYGEGRNSGSNIFGVYGTVQNATTVDAHGIHGHIALDTGDAATGNLYAVWGDLDLGELTHGVSSIAYGVYSKIDYAKTNGTFENAYGVYTRVKSSLAGASGSTISNAYGVYIEDQKDASAGTITNSWGIYQQGASDSNYFAGATVIGEGNTTDTDSLLEVKSELVSRKYAGKFITQGAWGSNDSSGIYGYNNATMSGGKTASGGRFQAYYGGTIGAGNMFGIYSQYGSSPSSPSGTGNSHVGIMIGSINSTRNADNIYGIHLPWYRIDSSTTIAQNAYGINFEGVEIRSGSTVSGDIYQLYLGTNTLSGTLTGTEYGIYQAESGAINVFKGNIAYDKQVYQEGGVHDAGNTGTSLTLNFDNGNVQKCTMNDASITIANPTNAKNGAVYTVCFIQDATASRTISTWGSNINWGDAGSPDFSGGTASGDKHYVTFIVNGTELDAIYSGVKH